MKCKHCDKEATKQLRFIFMGTKEGRTEKLYCVNKSICPVHVLVIDRLLGTVGLDEKSLSVLTNEMREHGYTVEEAWTWDFIDMDWNPDSEQLERVGKTKCHRPNCNRTAIGKSVLTILVQWPDSIGKAYIEGQDACAEHLAGHIAYRADEIALALHKITRLGGVPLPEGMTSSIEKLDWDIPAFEKHLVKDLKAEEETRNRRQAKAHLN